MSCSRPPHALTVSAMYCRNLSGQVPPKVSGRVTQFVGAGNYSVKEVLMQVLVICIFSESKGRRVERAFAIDNPRHGCHSASSSQLRRWRWTARWRALCSATSGRCGTAGLPLRSCRARFRCQRRRFLALKWLQRHGQWYRFRSATGHSHSHVLLAGGVVLRSRAWSL